MKLNEKIKERILNLLKRPDMTMADVADAVGVSVRTLHYWASDDKEFQAKIYESKALADEIVEASLFQRAIGYSHDSEKKFLDKEGKVTSSIKTVQHYPPDTGAAQYWLNNRSPEKWKSKTEVEHSGKISMPDDKLEARIEELQNKLKKK